MGKSLWNSAGGLLLISPNDAPPSASFPSTEIWVTGICYAGAVGGGGSFSGNSILLEDPEGTWRVRSAGAYLHFERKHTNDDGSIRWDTWQRVGASTATDSLIITKPHAIYADLENNLDDGNSDTDLRTVFKINGVDKTFNFSSGRHQTVIETKQDTEVQRSHISSISEIEPLPLADKVFILDRTDTPEPDSVEEFSWLSVVSFDSLYEWVRYLEMAFDFESVSDDVEGVHCRLAIYDEQGNLILENVTEQGLDAGISNGFKVKSGRHFYKISPMFQERKGARFITKIKPMKGHKVVMRGDPS